MHRAPWSCVAVLAHRWLSSGAGCRVQRRDARALRRVLIGLAFVPALPAIATAGHVRIVDASGSAPFTSIQAAIDAAVDGDVLLVGAGTYPGFTVDGKGLVLLAPSSALVTSAVVIANL